METAHLFPEIKLGDQITMEWRPTRFQRLLVALRLKKPFPPTKTFTVTAVTRSLFETILPLP